MEAFRQRQSERPAEVPTNIERQNKRSVLRSEKAAGDTSTAGETAVPEPVRDVISSRGQSLDPSIQRAMEDRMDDSFGDVRIHTGSTAAEACESINARAFTVGNHIAFNSGEYDPESPAGQHVLAHELTHVRQQTEGAVSMLPQEDMELEVDPDPALEREAEETAQRVVTGRGLGIRRLADSKVHVQRSKHWEKQKRDKKGKFGEFDEKYQHEEDIEDKPYANSRPEYAEGQVETVWSRAKEKGLDNNVRDPNTGEILEWDREKSRKGQWDMGHEPGEEYWRKHEAYMDGTISKEEFLNWYTNPDNYRPEAPSPNRSRKYEERKDD